MRNQRSHAIAFPAVLEAGCPSLMIAARFVPDVSVVSARTQDERAPTQERPPSMVGSRHHVKRGGNDNDQRPQRGVVGELRRTRISLTAPA